MYKTDKNGTLYDPERDATGEQIANEIGKHNVGRVAMLTAAAGLLLWGAVKIQDYFTNLPKIRQRQYQAAHFCLSRDDPKANKIGIEELERLANDNVEGFLAGDNLQDRAQKALQEKKGN